MLQASGHSDIVEALSVLSPIKMQMSFRKQRQRYFCSVDDVRFRMIKAGDEVRPIWLNGGCPKAIGSCFARHLKHAGESCPKQSLKLFESLQSQTRFIRVQKGTFQLWCDSGWKVPRLSFLVRFCATAKREDFGRGPWTIYIYIWIHMSAHVTCTYNPFVWYAPFQNHKTCTHHAHWNQEIWRASSNPEATELYNTP